MSLLWIWTSALAAPDVSMLVQLEAGVVTCADAGQTHGASVELVLDEPALVYGLASAWDGTPGQVALSDPSNAVCHGYSLHQESVARDGSDGVSLARLLPAGTHAVELSAPESTSAVLEVSVLRLDDLMGWGIRREVAEAALKAADHGWTEGAARRSTLAIIDFSRPSTEERIWLVDLHGAELQHHLLLTHGKGSGHWSRKERAVRFSNVPFSNQSSLGLFVASETYIGSNGRSMRLDGLEAEVNDLARERQIVFHGAEYARMDHIAEWGYLGRSHGCPAVDDRIAQVIIDALHDGGLLYSWYPDRGFFAQSEVLR